MPKRADPNFDPYDRSGWIVRKCADCGEEFKVRSYHRYARCDKCRKGKKGRLQTRSVKTNVCPRCGNWKHFLAKKCMQCYKRDLAERKNENMPAAETIEVAEMVKRERAKRKGLFEDFAADESTQLRVYRDEAREQVAKKQVGYVAPPVVEKSVEEQLKELL